MPRTIHVIGAGLAGLSAAVRFAERRERIVLHEAAPQAGGRCRSYHDPALDMAIDNGNHLVLSGNRATLDYLHRIGSADRLVGPREAAIEFIDLATHERWTLRPNTGRLPWWIFDAKRRVPGTHFAEYFAAARLLWPGTDRRIDSVLRCRGPLYERLLHPLLLAALNTDPPEASASLAGVIIRETLGAGGASCRPLIARDGLAAAFVEPALRFLEERKADIRFGHRLRDIGFGHRAVTLLDFGEEAIALNADDVVLLAVPPQAAASLVPGLSVPNEFQGIVNGHFRVPPPPGFPPMIGLIHGTVEWIFAFPERLAVTISGADRLMDMPREELAATLWREVAAVAGLKQEMPRWQIVRERRATFAATPAQNARRPGARTAWANLALAGDWTATGLPATIEGAIRSGNRAADLLAV